MTGPTLQDALGTLAAAKSPSALAQSHWAVVGAVKRARQGFRQQLGTLAQTYVAAMAFWDAQKADGVPIAERFMGLDKTLRAAWPKGREEPWRDNCAECRDYGLVMATCPGDATCGRTKRHLPHGFGSPCWCALGKRFQEKSKPDPSDFTAAGRTSKPLTRVGR